MRKQKTMLLIGVVLIVGTAIVVLFIVNHAQPSDSAKASGGTATIETSDVHYTAPANWATLSQQELTSEGAASGIARTTNPPAKFTIAIEPAATSPKSLALLQSLTLPGLQRLTAYRLLSAKATTIGGQAAEQYSYSFKSSTTTEQQLIVTLHGGRAFSLLFTANQKDFDSIASDSQQILNSFKFK